MRATLLIASILLALGPSTGQAASIFVSNERDNTVTVLDLDTLEVQDTIKTGERPRGIVTTPDHREVLVCAGDDARLDAIDPGTRKISRSLESGPDPELLAVDPAGKRIYIANEDDAMVMDLASGEVLKEIVVGVEPEGMAVSPDSRLVVATSESTSMAHFIDADSLEVVANVLVHRRYYRG